MDVRSQFGLRRVINVCGVPSAFGAGSACKEAVNAAARILPLAVDIIDLQRVASTRVAKATGAEAGCVTGCAAAAITVCVAATLTGVDLVKVRELPRLQDRRRQVLVQPEHESSCGAPLRQMVEITGAKLVRVGKSGLCNEEELLAALTGDVCAAFFVLSVTTSQGNALDLPRFVEICQSKGVTVIVDGAAEMDVVAPIAAGADLAIFSAQKILGGLTAGIIAGRRKLVAACHLQERGIGRPMKAGKEAVIGAVAALDRWTSMDMTALGQEWDRRLRLVESELSGLRGLAIRQEPDPYGRSFRRLRIDVDPERAGLNAWEFAALLRGADPAVVVWPFDVDQGVTFVDVRCATDDDILTACAMIRRLLDRAPERADRIAPQLVGHDLIDQEYLVWPERLQDPLGAIRSRTQADSDEPLR